MKPPLKWLTIHRRRSRYFAVSTQGKYDGDGYSIQHSRTEGHLIALTPIHERPLPDHIVPRDVLYAGRSIREAKACCEAHWQGQAQAITENPDHEYGVPARDFPVIRLQRSGEEGSAA